MPLIQSKSATAAASILARVQQLAGNYQAAAIHLNAISSDVLALSDSDLAAFCNQQGASGINDLTGLHVQHGTLVTNLSSAASAILADSGIQWPVSSVDVRSLNERLAEQGRELILADNSFSVVTITDEAADIESQATPQP